MKLYLVRHGDARRNEPRPLSGRGIKESRKVAKHLLDMGIEISAIFYSKELRAKETAGIFSRKLGVEPSEVAGLNPGDNPRTWFKKIGEIGEDVMLVGHLPHLTLLLSLLLAGSDADLVDFRKSSIICLEGSGDHWIMKYFLTPESI